MNIPAFVRRNLQTILNLALFGALGYGAAYRAYHAWLAKDLNLVEAAFFTHNVILLLVILIRREHVAIDRDLVHQAIALFAFMTGIAFDEKPTVSNALFLNMSRGVTLLALTLGTISLVNLGRSFGILISLRKVKTTGLYSVIRHPMYATDIVWRLGFILQNASAFNLVLMAASSGAYVYRALLEEEFLKQFAEYREYMQRVRHRFIPGVF